MEYLHAPWRIKYILSEKPEGCFFCEAAGARAADFKQHLLLYRSDSMLVLMNRYPYNGGHLLVAPLRHTGDISELSNEETDGLMRLAQLSVAVLEKSMSPDGFNIGMNLGRTAGAGIEDHIHLHVVPRWNGDSNFLPVLDETRSVPVALDELWEQLKPAFDSTAASGRFH